MTRTPKINVPDGKSTFDRLLRESIEALRLDKATGGLVVLLDGFFAYEQTRHGVRGVVAPRTSLRDVFWAAFSVDGAGWTWVEPPPKKPQQPMRAHIGSPVDARIAPDNRNRASYQWIPHWSGYMKVPPIHREWRQASRNRLWFDMACAGGLVSALPDRTTLGKRFDWSGGAFPDQRVSTVGLYAQEGPGVLTVTGGATHCAPFGAAAHRWAMLVVSNRQFVRADDEEEANSAREGAHDQALIAIAGLRNPKQRPKYTVRRSRMRGAFKPAVDEVIAKLTPVLPKMMATEKLGCNHQRLDVR